jgi:hypothetical protein
MLPLPLAEPTCAFLNRPPVLPPKIGLGVSASSTGSFHGGGGAFFLGAAAGGAAAAGAGGAPACSALITTTDLRDDELLGRADARAADEELRRACILRD